MSNALRTLKRGGWELTKVKVSFHEVSKMELKLYGWTLLENYLHVSIVMLATAAILPQVEPLTESNLSLPEPTLKNYLW